GLPAADGVQDLLDDLAGRLGTPARPAPHRRHCATTGPVEAGHRGGPALPEADRRMTRSNGPDLAELLRLLDTPARPVVARYLDALAAGLPVRTDSVAEV